MDMDMTRIHTFQAPTRLVFGVNAAQQVGAEVEGARGSRALVVTDPGIEQAGLLPAVTDSLAAAGLDRPGLQGGRAEPDRRRPARRVCRPIAPPTPT